MNIISDSKNEHLKRREVRIEVEAEKTPSLTEMQTQVAEKLKAASELVVIKSIRSNFGKKQFQVDAFVYSSAEDKTKFEPKIKVKKDSTGAAAPAGGKK
jgi:ribosomal protein S24E